MLTKKFLSLFLFFYFASNLFFTPTLEAASLHVILVGDSLNDQDPTGFEGGVDLWRREAKKIAAYTGLELEGVIFEGHHCRIEHVMRYIEELKIESDDIVILYFAMHGSRTKEKTNRWPDLSFSLDQQKIDFNLFNDLLREKNPRLFLSIADSCNNIVSDRVSSNQVNNQLYLGQEEEDRQVFTNTSSFTSLLVGSTSNELLAKYKRLFLDHSGSIIISTSSPGQFSIKHCLTGGVFTTQLIETFRKKEPATAIHWNRLLSDVTRQTTHKVESLKTELDLAESQIPQFELNLSVN